MTEKTTLLAHLASEFINQKENAATSALAFILNESRACLDTLNSLLRDEGFDLSITEITTQERIGDSQPDMIGRDRKDDDIRLIRLVVEVKFWANLGENQASRYFDLLAEEGPGALLFIAPESGRETLWKETKSQMDKAEKKIECVESFEGGRRARIAGSDKRLFLVGWVWLLDRMAKAVPNDPETASDIRQLRGLARQQDAKAFQPIHSEELAPDLPRRILQINQLIDDVITRGRDELEITTKDRRPRHQDGYGQYFRFTDVEGEFFIEVNFYLWATISDTPTPLWLGIYPIVPGYIAKLRSEFPSIRQSQDGYIQVPIELKTGEESQAVLNDIISQIGKIKSVLK